MSAYDWDLHRVNQHPHPQQLPQQHPRQQFAVDESPPPSQPPPSLDCSKGGKRSRQTYSKYQTAVLERVFQTSKYIVRSKRQQMSTELNLTERQIKIWFQNRRMKEKKCHKDTPRIDSGDDDHLHAICPSAVAGYAAAAVDDYATIDHAVPGYLTNCNNSGDDPFANCSYERPTTKHHDDHVVGGYGGYDLLTTVEHDSYKQQQPWPPVTVDFHQDYYDNHELNTFQKLPMAHHHHHHHHSLNSQIPDFCSPQLQTANGY